MALERRRRTDALPRENAKTRGARFLTGRRVLIAAVRRAVVLACVRGRQRRAQHGQVGPASRCGVRACPHTPPLSSGLAGGSSIRRQGHDESWMISLHRSMHPSQMLARGAVISFLTCCTLFPQKEHRSVSPRPFIAVHRRSSLHALPSSTQPREEGRSAPTPCAPPLSDGATSWTRGADDVGSAPRSAFALTVTPWRPSCWPGRTTAGPPVRAS
jgi:hypothetical protein